MTFALGIDLGGSSIKAVAVTPEGRLLGESNVPFDVSEHFDWARRIQSIVDELSAAAQASLAPQRGEGLRVRGGAAEQSPFTPSATVTPTPHPGLPQERTASLELAAGATRELPVTNRQHAGPAFQDTNCRLAQAIGLSAPGLAATDGRSIAVMPGRLKGLEGLDWTEFLHGPRSSRGHKTPSEKGDQSLVTSPATNIVPVLNDAHAALLGEAWLGAARGFRNVFMLTLGTGVGGAALVDGRLLKGTLGRAGHLGHISLDVNGPLDVCGMPGSLEVMMGNCSISQRTGGRFQTTHELVEAHRRGNDFATEVWLKSVRALGVAVASLINVLDPEAVIIGGGIARAGAALFDPLEQFVRAVEWNVGAAPVKIIPAQLGELAGAYGAAWKAGQIRMTNDE